MKSNTKNKVITGMLLAGFLTVAGSAEPASPGTNQPSTPISNSTSSENYAESSRPVVFEQVVSLRGRVLGETETYLAVKLEDDSLAQVPKSGIDIRADLVAPRRNNLLGQDVVFPLRSDEVYYILDDNGRSVRLSGRNGVLVLPRDLLAQLTPQVPESELNFVETEEPSDDEGEFDSQELEVVKFAKGAS